MLPSIRLLLYLLQYAIKCTQSNSTKSSNGWKVSQGHMCTVSFLPVLLSSLVSGCNASFFLSPWNWMQFLSLSLLHFLFTGMLISTKQKRFGIKAPLAQGHYKTEAAVRHKLINKHGNHHSLSSPLTSPSPPPQPPITAVIACVCQLSE